MASETKLYCSFCGKSSMDVAQLIAGPTVLVCDECVDLLTEVIADERKAKAEKVGVYGLPDAQ